MSESLNIDLYLIRHAETNLNLNRGLVGGRSNDAELSRAGPGQARRLGWRLRQAETYPDMVFSSPAVRCRDTAAFCLQALGRSAPEIVIDDRLQEASQGIWEGQPRDTIYTDTTVAEIIRQGKDFRAPSGESVNDVAERKLEFINELPSQFDGQTGSKVVFGFGHGYAIRILAGSLLDWPMEDMRREITPNTSDSLFTYNGEDGWRVKNVGELVIPSV